MSWILFSILPPFIWTITNFIDKFLIEKYFKKSHGAAMMLLVVSFGILIVPFIYFFSGANFHLSLIHIVIAFISAGFSIASWTLYARALSGSNVSVVVPLFQLMPIFSYILGSIFLKEKLGLIQIIASAIIILGSILISLELSEEKLTINKKVILPMMLVAFLSSTNVFLVKYLMLGNGFWTINFWNYLFLGLLSIAILTCIRSYRQEVAVAFKASFIGSGGVAFANQLLDFCATMLYRFAMLLAPMALVSVLSNGFQPVFALLIGVILHLFLPRFSHEKFTKTELVQRTIAILVIFIGTFLINK